MLYLVSTPIGNLQDISTRALDTLSNCDYILCEDTRHSKLLLKHFQIDKPLKSFHKFNEVFKENNIIDDLKNGKTIALISDAGTPCISDPGTRIVQRCRQEGIRVSGIPGACSPILALVISGFETDRFQFVGFLPKKSGALQTSLAEYYQYPGTTICFESPYRLLKVLKIIQISNKDCQLCVARELTKKFEEVRSGTATDLIAHFEKHTLKGEIILIISGIPVKNGKKKKKLENKC